MNVCHGLCKPGLPVGTETPNFGRYVLEGLGKQNVAIFYGHLVNFVVVCIQFYGNFDTFCCHFHYIFPPILVYCIKKNLATLIANEIHLKMSEYIRDLQGAK
jgi:hypothetical protein